MPFGDKSDREEARKKYNVFQLSTMSEGADQSSFASILAGVKRMREQYGEDESASSLQQYSRTNLQQPQPALPSIPPSTQFTTALALRNAPPAVSVPTPVQIQARLTAVPHLGNLRTGSPSPRPAGNGLSGSYTSIQVSKSQKGNPLLSDSFMKTTPYDYNSKILSDYYINPKLQILFLSTKYHNVHPEYIWQRVKALTKGSSTAISGSDNVLRILLLLIDVDSPNEVIRKFLDFCVKQDLTLVLAWSYEEAGNYICFCKEHEMSAQKQKSIIKGNQSTDYYSTVQNTLTSIRAVNKTDVTNLLGNLKSFERIVLESTLPESTTLSKIHGLGKTKVDNMRQVFLEPFIYNKNYDE